MSSYVRGILASHAVFLGLGVGSQVRGGGTWPLYVNITRATVHMLAEDCMCRLLS
jgi:hypothetical protein